MIRKHPILTQLSSFLKNVLLLSKPLHQILISTSRYLLKWQSHRFFNKHQLTNFALLKAKMRYTFFNSYLFQTQIEKTPEINPIDHDPSKFEMTPLCIGLSTPQFLSIMDEFVLQCETDLLDPQSKYSKRLNYHKHKEPKQKNNFLIEILSDEQIFNFIPDLQLEDGMHIFYEMPDYSSQLDEQLSYYSDDCEQSSLKHKQILKKTDLEEGQQCIQFYQTIERFKQNPKKQIIKKIKQIQNSTLEESENNKKIMIKKLIEKYLLDFQIYCYEEAWKQLENHELNQVIQKITQGLNETFNKKIGKLPFQIRRNKILKYLEKKKKRIWKKKVSYDCRKKVADGRLRIKGKFVTRQQACSQLGVQNLEGCTAEEIKHMLEKRLEGNQEEN